MHPITDISKVFATYGPHSERFCKLNAWLFIYWWLTPALDADSVLPVTTQRCCPWFAPETCYVHRSGYVSKSSSIEHISFGPLFVEQFERGLVCFGKFDGQQVTLAAAVSGNRVLLHSPHVEDKQASPTTFLRVKQKVVALAAGTLMPFSSCVSGQHSSIRRVGEIQKLSSYAWDHPPIYPIQGTFEGPRGQTAVLQPAAVLCVQVA